MIALELINNEKLQFQYLLPSQGSFLELELVEGILKKVEEIDNGLEDQIIFEKNEIEFLIRSISFLDQQKMLNLQSLSLIRKILNLKETTKDV